jgi:dolichyl-phosphate beta-glucosyltransferase
VEHSEHATPLAHDLTQQTLSIVIPAYNEATRLPITLPTLRAFLDQERIAAEVIVVDDGSADGTAAFVQDYARKWGSLRLVGGQHQGKGGAVRMGVLASQGDYVALADADFSMPASELNRFAPSLVGPYDLAIGSREGAASRRIGEPAYRHLMGRVFNKIVQVLLLPGIEDTQCGFKLIRGEVARELCERQTITGWGFDVELLYIARRQGYRIREVSITWYYVEGSRIHPIRDTISMLRDVLRIRCNGRKALYSGAARAGPEALPGSTANEAQAKRA